MKKLSVVSLNLLLAALCAYGQGTFLYDQQSSTDEGYYGYGTGQTLDSMLPHTGQSFTPTLPGIDFIRLEINDNSQSGTVGSTWYLNLHSGSITGPTLGITASVGLPGGFTGAANFFFPTTVPVTAGTTYYFDINSPDGGAWHLIVGQIPYAGGNAWGRDQALASVDYWFREGLVVPEPSSVALLLLGAGALACLRRAKVS